MVQKVIIVICMFFLACPTDWFNRTEKHKFGEPFSLKVGKKCEMIPDNLAIGFRKVIADSRCPLEVNCVWEGRADLDVWLRPAGEDTVFIIPHIFGYVTREYSMQHVSVDTLGYKITLRQLDPYPKHDITNDYSNYVAEFVVTKN